MDRNSPDFRATVPRDGTVRLVDWGPWLATGGPLNTLMHARGKAGVAIADLTIVRDDSGVPTEVIVEFRCGGRRSQRDALRSWAARVGYGRVWFDGEVVDLQPNPGGAAQTRCTGCGVRLIDADPSFWDYVRCRGAFPTACVLCGSDLPQWTPLRQTPPDGRDSTSTEPIRRTLCN